MGRRLINLDSGGRMKKEMRKIANDIFQQSIDMNLLTKHGELTLESIENLRTSLSKLEELHFLDNNTSLKDNPLKSA